MNCETYKRRLLEDPMQNDGQMLEHERACTACQSYAREVRAREIEIRALLRISPPPDLATRVRLAVMLEQSKGESRRRYLGIIAGIAILVGALAYGWLSAPLQRPRASLAETVLRHIQEEPDYLRETGPVPRFALDALFAHFGAAVSGELGSVNFAAQCLIRKDTGIHLVMDGDIGPITVIFMPQEMLGAPRDLADSRFTGLLYPTAWGSLAVVGEQGESLEGMAEEVLDSVTWPAVRPEHGER